MATESGSVQAPSSKDTSCGSLEINFWCLKLWRQFLNREITLYLKQKSSGWTKYFARFPWTGGVAQNCISRQRLYRPNLQWEQQRQGTPGSMATRSPKRKKNAEMYFITINCLLQIWECVPKILCLKLQVLSNLQYLHRYCGIIIIVDGCNVLS